MNAANTFVRLAAAWGQTIELVRGETLLGSGRAVLRPVLNGERQFVPTDLGLERRETMLCLAEAALPFDPVPGETVVRQGADSYDVVNVRPLRAGETLVCWRAILARRDGEAL